MEIIFEPQAKSDLDFWVKTGNKIILKKIAQLIKSIKVTPFDGIGKPEPLKYSLSGAWSRRINQELRLVYEITDLYIVVLSARGHYE